MENRNSIFCLSLFLILSLLARERTEITLEALRMFLQAGHNDQKKKKKAAVNQITQIKPMQNVPVNRNYSGSIRVHVLVNELYPNFHGETLGATSLLYYDGQSSNYMDTFDDVFRAKSLAQGINFSDDDIDVFLAANNIELSQFFDRNQNCVNRVTDSSSIVMDSSVGDVVMSEETQDPFQTAISNQSESDDFSPCNVPFESLSLDDIPASVDSGVHDADNEALDYPNDAEGVLESPAEIIQELTEVEFDPNESFLTGDDVDELFAGIDEEKRDFQLDEFPLDNNISGPFQIQAHSDADNSANSNDNNLKYESESATSDLSPNDAAPYNNPTSSISHREFFTVARKLRDSKSSRYTSINGDSTGSSSVDYGEYEDASRSSARSISSSDFSTHNETDYPTSSHAFYKDEDEIDEEYQDDSTVGASAAGRDLSMNTNSENQHKDVQLLLEAHVPFTYEEVAYSSNEQFRKIRSTPGLTDAQCSAMLDARRRATNRKAAERCRQQKNIERNGLSVDLKHFVDKKRNLERQVAKARHRRDRARDTLAAERNALFSRLRDSSNRPLHPNQWKMQLTEEGQIMLVRREISSES